MPKKVSKKTSKKSNKRPTKRSSKKASITKSYSPPSEQNYFSLVDNNVFEILKSYKNVYEYILHESLNYKIEITPINSSLGETTVSYFLMGSSNPTLNTKMHIAGYLDGNTWTWNEYQKQRHYNSFTNYVLPLISNINVRTTLQKLFVFTQITFPEKYRHTIPYLLSYMYDPARANIIRFTNDLLSNHSYTFIYMEIPLTIPYWYEMTDHIAKEFNIIGYNFRGGDLHTNTKNIRAIKDESTGYYYKNCHKLNKLIDKQ